MLASMFKRTPAAISVSGTLRRPFRNPSTRLSTINKLDTLPFHTSAPNKIQGDHDWFLIPPEQYWHRTARIKAAPSPACLACENLSCSKSGASLAKKQQTQPLSTLSDQPEKPNIFKSTLQRVLLRAIFYGKVFVGLTMFSVAVLVVDDVLINTITFSFAKEEYSFEATVEGSDILMITIPYKLRPLQWLLLGAVKSLLDAANGQEYVKAWSGIEEELED